MRPDFKSTSYGNKAAKTEHTNEQNLKKISFLSRLMMIFKAVKSAG